MLPARCKSVNPDVHPAGFIDDRHRTVYITLTFIQIIVPLGC